jgi:hypothetical protein
MILPPCRHDLEPDLLAAGDRFLAAIGPQLDAADVGGRVAPGSRLLCSALGLLGVETYRALGGRGREDDVGRASAMLSLLTKIDDQWIDAPEFHGGAGTPRAELRARVRAFLAPTLASVRAARPANEEPRCAFAAALGEALRGLDPEPCRMAHLLDTLAMGWEVQVEAVSVLTSDPEAVTLAEVASITRRISGAWLLMIAMVGVIPGDVARALSPEEEEAFFAWGSALQRADALADLEKDLADLHLSSWVGKLLSDRAPAETLAAARRGDARAIYALAREHEVDRDSLPGPAELVSLRALLPALGEVGPLIEWTHGYLVRRYLSHPLCARLAAPTAGGRLFPPRARSTPFLVGGAEAPPNPLCSAP